MDYLRTVLLTLFGRFSLLILAISITAIPLGPVAAFSQENEVVVLEEENKEVVVEEVEDDEPVTTEEGMSTGMKIGIGVGAAALVGVVALAAGGGGSSSSSSEPDTPQYATNEDVVGPWYAVGTRMIGEHATYNGTYTLYSNGSHQYDLFVTDGRHKVGSGSWTLNKNYLELRNESGSTYRGHFKNENFTKITVITTDGRWATDMKKQ